MEGLIMTHLALAYPNSTSHLLHQMNLPEGWRTGSYAKRRCLSLLAGIGACSAALVLSSAAAIADCNSGNNAENYLLTSANCQALARGSGSIAVGGAAIADSANSTALGFQAGDESAGEGATAVGAFAGRNGGG